MAPFWLCWAGLGQGPEGWPSRPPLALPGSVGGEQDGGAGRGSHGARGGAQEGGGQGGMLEQGGAGPGVQGERGHARGRERAGDERRRHLHQVLLQRQLCLWGEGGK